MTTFLETLGASRKESRRTVLMLLCSLIISTSIPVDAKNSPGLATDEGRPSSEDTDQIEAKADRIIEAAMKEKKIPGVVLGIVKSGQVALSKGYGVKSLQSDARPDQNTVFYIASLSKAITAFGVMLLVDEHKVRLEDPASKFLKGLPPRWQRISLRQFMTHTSGIPQLDRKLPTFEAMLRNAVDLPMEFEPGTDQIYNNFNFAVAGQVIEAVSGMKYLDFMKRRVFGPLQMNHTGYGVLSDNSAEGYDLTDGRAKPVGEHRIFAGPFAIASGHLQSTMADLLKFEAAIRQGKLLSAAAYREMITPVALPSGKTKPSRGTPGWFAREAGGVKIIHKNGAGQGFHSDFHFVPGRGDAVILLWNLTGRGSDLRATVDDLMQAVLGISQPEKAAESSEASSPAPRGSLLIQAGCAMRSSKTRRYH